MTQQSGGGGSPLASASPAAVTLTAGSAAQRIYGDVPPVAGIYGPSGGGKTTDCIYLDPEALFLAGKGALKPAISVIQIEPKHARDDCDDLDAIVKAIIEERKKRRVRTLVIDDLSLAVKNTVAKLEGAKHTGWALWKALNRKLLQPGEGLLPVCRDMGIKVVFNCHDKAPGEDGSPGGPNLPGQLLEELPRNIDMMLLMTADPSREPHGASYRCSLKHYPTWRTKDRHDVCWERTPPNLAEILRAAGYLIERPVGFEWLDNYVEHIAQQIAAAGFAGTMAVKPAAWILRDAMDRAEIRKHQQDKYKLRLGIPVT